MWAAFDHYRGWKAVHDPITMTVATVASGALSAAGTLAGGAAAADAGNAQRSSSYFKAAQEEQAAQEGRAASQRTALDKDRQSRLLQSSLQANAAASGGGAADPTVVGLGQDIAGRGEYQSLMDLYTGENRGRGLEDQAMSSRLTGNAQAAEGDAKKNASYLSAAGTLIGSAGSAYKTYKTPGLRDSRSLDQIAYG